MTERESLRRLAIAVVAICLLAGCSGDEPSGNGNGPTLTKIAGDLQTAPAGTLLSSAVIVSVKDEDGAPIANAPVLFTIMSGGGAVSDTVVTTSAGGTVQTDWYLGTAPSVSNRLRASYSGVSVEYTAQSLPSVAGATYFGDEQYIEYLAGNLPIVITAPHGGTLTPAAIPDRTGTGIEIVRDTNTEELARAISDAFFQRFGSRPHVIICRLRRTKLDANREIVEAAQGNRTAQRAWFEFHHFTQTAKTRLMDDYSRGLYMDLHGHGHAIARLELGYLLSASQLQLSDATLLSATYSNASSIRSLVQSSGSTFPQLLRGQFSLGALFEAEGVPAVPSPSQPDPGPNDYFSGGYNTARHGSRDGGTISGFQLESHFAGVRDTPANRSAFAAALVDVFAEYLQRHFGITL